MHLLQRGTTSTYQIRVPSDLGRILGDTPFRTSLGALTRREAQRRARLLAGHAELAFVRVRRVVLETAAEGSEIDEGLREAIDEALSGLACAYDERYLNLQEYEQALQELEKALEKREAAVTRYEAFLKDAHQKLSPTLMADTPAVSLDDRLARIESQLRETSSTAAAAGDAPLFSEAVADFLKGKRSALGEKSTFVARRALALRAFQDIVGDRPLDQYHTVDLQEFMAVVGQLPRDWAKTRRFQGMSLREVAAANSSLPRPLPRLVTTTANEYLAAVRSLWRAARVPSRFRRGSGSATRPRRARTNSAQRCPAGREGCPSSR